MSSPTTHADMIPPELSAVLMDGIALGVAVVRRDGGVLVCDAWNHFCIQLFGVDKEQAVGAVIKDALGDDLAETIQNKVEHTLAAGQRTEFAEEPVLSPELGPKIVDITMIPISGIDEAASTVLILFRDVTEGKQVEESVQQASRFAEEDPNPVMRFSAVGELMFANRAAEVFLPALQDDSGKLKSEWLSRFTDTLHGCMAQRCEAFHNDSVYTLTIAPITDYGYVNVYAQDDTAAKRSQQSTRESEKRMRMVLESMPVLMTAYDECNNLVVWNRECERVTGYSADEMIGHDDALERLYPNEAYRNGLADNIERVRGNFRGYETVVTCKNGRKKAISWSDISREFQIAGWSSWSIGVDVTERKRAQEKLRFKNEALANMNKQLNQNQQALVQSEKMAGIGQLAAGVAHEINNPVGFVKSNLGTLGEYVASLAELVRLYDLYLTKGGESTKGEIDALREREDIDFLMQDVEQLLAESADGITRVQEIVQNLKSFARVDEAGRRMANINDCLESTLKIVWNELKYNCTVHKEYGDIPQILCFPGQLNQVFMNLLVNASHAIEGQGDITVRTYVDNDDLIVSITDTGCGITQENISKLFDPFFTTKDVGKGTGLGLSISHGIIEKHGGMIEVLSTVGVGTTFNIHLPVVTSEDEEE